MNKPTEHCRVVVTDDCNLSCEFCCMQDDDVYNSFTDATALHIARQKHKEVNITGGEPLLALPQVIMLSQIVRYFNPAVSVYLYTNGEMLNLFNVEILASCGVVGLNISLHNWEELDHSLMAWVHRNKIPIRFLANKDELNEEIEEMVDDYQIPIRIWELDDCNDMDYESRYRLIDPPK